MTDAWHQVLEWFEHPMARAGLRAAVMLLIAFVVARIVKRRIASGGDQRLLAARLAGGAIFALGCAAALSELGLSLGVLLGAAGVMTIAVGFAAQTAVSNLISGLFLIVEKPFKLGNVITVGATTGEVVTIDLLSTKLRTFDNLLVRIPNEVLLKAEVKNLSHFPIRRIDVIIRLASRSDLDVVDAAFVAVASEIPLCLDEPRPSILVDGFDDSGVIVKLMVWAASTDFVAVKNQLQKHLPAKLADAEVEIGVPQRKVAQAA